VQFTEAFNLKLLQPAKPVAKSSAMMTPDFLTQSDPSQE
jgi:hypothetical protein